MRKANDESLDSPFMPHSIYSLSSKTRILKQMLCGGISANSPTYFQLKYIDILDEKSRTQELLKGYKLAEKSDYKLIHHPELVHQDKKYFNYEDFKYNGGKNAFDYSTMKSSDLIDLLADKRPDLKKNSKFYTKYSDKLSKDGFGLTRGMFTLESNQQKKFGSTNSSRFFIANNQKQKSLMCKKNAQSQFNINRNSINGQAKEVISVNYQSGKSNVQRFFENKQVSAARPAKVVSRALSINQLPNL